MIKCLGDTIYAASRYGFFIYGTGGHAKVIYSMLDKHDPVVFIDDNNFSARLTFESCYILNSWKKIPTGARVIPAIGDSNVRENIVSRLRNNDSTVSIKGVFHKTAYSDIDVPSDAQICAKAVIIAGTRLGQCVIINTGATIDHDCTLGDFVHIAPGVNLCGGVSVGNNTLIGVGSCVRPGVTLGSNTIVGAGSVVVEDIPSNVVAFGNPCRVVKENK